MFEIGASGSTSWLFNTASESSKTNVPFTEFKNTKIPTRNEMKAENLREYAVNKRKVTH